MPFKRICRPVERRSQSRPASRPSAAGGALKTHPDASLAYSYEMGSIVGIAMTGSPRRARCTRPNCTRPNEKAGRQARLADERGKPLRDVHHSVDDTARIGVSADDGARIV